MPIKCNFRFNTCRQQREDKYSIITSIDDESGSSLSLQNVEKGQAALDMDTSKRHTNASTTAATTSSPSSSEGQWGIYVEAVTGIAHHISALWTSARSHIGSALNKMKRRKSKCGEMWTVRISTEYTDNNDPQTERRADSEMDFESQEEAKLFVYQWNKKTVCTKSGSKISYKAVMYLKDSSCCSGGEVTCLPLTARPTTENGSVINGVVNLDCSVVEAEEEA